MCIVKCWIIVNIVVYESFMMTFISARLKRESRVIMGQFLGFGAAISLHWRRCS